MNYHSTRSAHLIGSSAALLRGLAEDNGLYLPERIPALDAGACLGCSYQEIAYRVLSLYFTEFAEADLRGAINAAYNDTNFASERISELIDLDPHRGVLELFHGPTCAFKDCALTLFPHLLRLARKMGKDDLDLCILTATSGDTGKAAMEALKDIEGMKIVVLYPYHGVSATQKMQMQKQKGSNVFPIGVRGDFDDAQRIVKELFNEPEFVAAARAFNTRLTSANSINIGRFLPQIIYYYDAYVRLVEAGTLRLGQAFDVFVPTGNFGNILAGIYARQMGLPIRKLHCAANENNVLAEFINSGSYDIRTRTLKQTPSPSMDILKASNLERFLYLISPDPLRVRQLMDGLTRNKRFDLDRDEIGRMQSILSACSCSNRQTETAIRSCWDHYHYLIDPHTAIAYHSAARADAPVYQLILATASPYKFIDVYRPVFQVTSAEALSAKTQTPIPKPILALETEPIRHDVCLPETSIREAIRMILAGTYHE